jgi:hypothetical protein
VTASTDPALAHAAVPPVSADSSPVPRPPLPAPASAAATAGPADSPCRRRRAPDALAEVLDRQRKCLARFGLDWQGVNGAGR